jgi:DNA-binding XRE family transcriptional regulator
VSTRAKAKRKTAKESSEPQERLPRPKPLGHGEFAGEDVVFVAREDWDNLVDFLEDQRAMERFERMEKEPPEAFIDIAEMRRRTLENRIKEVRRAKGITQVELAEKLGCKQSYISKIEHPDYRPRSSTLKKVAKALRCAVEDLI